MDLEKIKTDYKAKVDALQAEMQQILKDAFKDIFEKCPSLGAIVWNQYSPYFNDGDECTFDVHEAELFRIGFDDEVIDELEEGDEFHLPKKPDSYYYRDTASSYSRGLVAKWEALENKEEVELAHALVKSVFGIDDAIFQATFGNHSKIIATREKFIVEDYSDHD